MGLRKIKIRTKPEERIYKRIEAEINQLTKRIENLRELISFCEVKIKINQDFLDGLKEDGKKIK